ncbi:MAG: MmgE/PrpD family protein [Acidimicrobiia bacterium]|nr:MmgE/PrpD family protein [Acidimicrobiia bacterium]
MITRRQFAALAAAVPLSAQGGLTSEVVEFVVRTRYDDIPADVIELGKKSILDSLGLAICGSVAESGKLAREHVKSLGMSGGRATVIGTAMKVPSRFAAFLNGLGIHADDYDDTQLAVARDRTYGLLTHPSATSVAAGLACAETAGAGGRDFMLAYQLAVEVQCKLAEASAPRHYEQGFHSTATFGTIGAAVAAAKVMGLDAGKTARAIGVAASSAAGLRENFGTMTKPLHAGRAAEAGVAAADLARLGWTATDKVLEAPRGFFRAASGGYSPEAIDGKLGKPWTFASPGISIKPHPSGSLTHPGMTELKRLIAEHKIKAADVERVDVGTNRNMPTALIHHKPQDHLQAKFSMEFCFAALLLYGRAGLREFTDEVVRREEVRRMIERIHFGVHPEAEAAGLYRMMTVIEIRMKDGRVIKGKAEWGKGSPQMPMSYDEVAEKFRDCADFAGWPAGKSAGIVKMVRGLEVVRDVRELAALCGA